ncbi:hypothetical protein CSA37_07920 [Candidatus Fermentibacteria bacterium]|nr:MAG: hypothetical protein CSA37_07920 [Candidatus Fermentibacteria bacterium]
MKKLAVFDLDGTLHHTELALAPAIAMAVSDITGREAPSFEEINSLYGEPLEVFCRKLTGTDGQEAYSRFMERVRYHQALTIPRQGALYAGTREMLEKLSEEGFDLAVLSNAHQNYIHEVTEALGIKGLFVMLQGRSGEASKTARLAEMIDGYDFAVMAGDRYHDIQAALENSIPAIACAYGYGSEKEHEGAVSVEEPMQIVQVVRDMLFSFQATFELERY